MASPLARNCSQIADAIAGGAPARGLCVAPLASEKLWFEERNSACEQVPSKGARMMEYQ